MDKIDKDDWKYVGVDPDPDFDADHNKWVIDESIRKYEKMKKSKLREWRESMKERASAIARYIKSDTSTPVDKYFGRKQMSYLRGEQIVERLKNAKTQQKS